MCIGDYTTQCIGDNNNPINQAVRSNERVIVNTARMDISTGKKINNIKGKYLINADLQQKVNGDDQWETYYTWWEFNHETSTWNCWNADCPGFQLSIIMFTDVCIGWLFNCGELVLETVGNKPDFRRELLHQVTHCYTMYNMLKLSCYFPQSYTINSPIWHGSAQQINTSYVVKWLMNGGLSLAQKPGRGRGISGVFVKSGYLQLIHFMGFSMN